MKQLLVAVCLVGLVAMGNAQEKKFSFGIGADVALPISSGFSDGWGIGIGGTAKGYYMFNEMVSFNATAGYMTFSGKDQTVGGVTVKPGSWSMIPVVVGARYYFVPASAGLRFYGAFEMGLIFSSYKQDIPAITFGGVVIRPASSLSVSGSDFTYQPQIGFEASKWDVAVRYIGVSGAGSVGARIGYIFN